MENRQNKVLPEGKARFRRMDLTDGRMPGGILPEILKAAGSALAETSYGPF